MFLYKEVLEIKLPWLDGIVRAKRPKHLPVVLTKLEVDDLLARMDGTVGLFVRPLRHRPADRGNARPCE